MDTQTKITPKTNNKILVQNSYKIVKILKKTKAKGLEDIQELDIIHLSIQLTKRGSDRNHNWQRPLVKVENKRTNNISYKEFSTLTKLLESFELEEVT
jgi:uncharacterized protein YehS (DUF1456 family)